MVDQGRMVIVEGVYESEVYLVPRSTVEEELAEAKRRFHAQFPGLRGTIKTVTRMVHRSEEEASEHTQ